MHDTSGDVNLAAGLSRAGDDDLVAADPSRERGDPRRVAAVLASAAVLPWRLSLPTRSSESWRTCTSGRAAGTSTPTSGSSSGRAIGAIAARIGETLRAPVAPGGEAGDDRAQAELVRNQPVPFRLNVQAGERPPRCLDSGKAPRLGNGRPGSPSTGKRASRWCSPLMAAGGSQWGDPGSGGDAVGVKTRVTVVIPTLEAWLHPAWRRSGAKPSRSSSSTRAKRRSTSRRG